MPENFPLNEFRLALATNSRIKASLQPFLREFRLNNMQWILAAVQELGEYLRNPKAELNLAFNSLFALKFILDNADVVMTHVVETYLLPTILDIASYEIQSKNEKRGDTYFISKGCEGKKEALQSSGYHFVRIAYELIMAVSQIKPRAICFNEELQQPSEFLQALQFMKKKGLQTYKSFMFYEVSILKETRISFLKSLQRYHKENAPFKLFFENFAKQYLSQGTEAKGNVSPFKLLEKGEATAIQAVVRECIKSLKSVDLRQRTRALKLMSDLVRWGDITVAYQINSEGTIGEIVREIADPKEKCLGFDRATKVLKKYQSSERDKSQYYRQLLRSLKLWGKCYPTAINSIDRVSNVKFLCGQLQKEGIQFPEYDKIFGDEAVFEQNRRRKLKLNERLFNYMQNMQGQRIVSLVNVHIDEAHSTFYQKKSTFQSFSQEIQKARNMLDTLCHTQDKVIPYIKALNKFCKDFDLKIEKGQFNSADLEYIINEGVPLVERTERIMPYLQQYQNNLIQFATLKATLNEKNKKLKMSQLYNSHTLSKLLISTAQQDLAKKESGVPRDSYQLDLLPQARIDLTESHELTVEEILKQKYKNKVGQAAPNRRSISSQDDMLMDFSVENLMQSKEHKRKCSPNCLKLLNKLESMVQYQEFQAITFKLQELRKAASKVA